MPTKNLKGSVVFLGSIRGNKITAYVQTKKFTFKRGFG